jgi:hypothetical protein
VEITLWIVQGLLALAFLGAGGMKLVTPRKRLIDSGSGMAWVNDFSAPAVKAIGTAEVLGAAGLVLPGVLGVATVLTPLAGVGLLLLMIGAVVTHIRRGERTAVAPPLVLGLLALVVAVARFGPYPL